ncbi:MAG TPA: MogA/MoaB family molybdenum cofactor biosynthesis protein [Gemmatimonadaceae bacterium]|nr:MogA/MoaB family molybdenum cofactor biosynthesis protein [Gemmatimonadaceae bacterium]
MSVPRGTQEHRKDAQRYASIRAAVLTVSDSRTTATDESGPLIRELLTSGLHTITQADLLPNDEERVRGTVMAWLGREDVDAIIITGGTGLGSRDRSIEAVRPLFDKEIPGFGELFRLLSFQEQIGSSSILSRATAGSARGKVVVVLPGSRAAVELAMQRIILPELPHLLREIRR